ncbi:tripartite tricarboxylate transporter substrate binding protein [Allopusillimonas soli]|uniref:Tripartite tricarboxylate transporter substrate binding protein n=1 Tax=Allopusillimonas soli TaxID=659016 RepID=A0A853FCH6_9BURK|nr:tripartite tricarboxylate transporter substrate-binding protein [Allopusillimonas soli]NYT37609.1 tripartite tricarboxylate transporter substrate binding protein [Allopusillimonas soli]TEA74428.1 tripartite tricarboxylate transporter substrate binding protein [Allopusillimonas soli]
MKNRNQAILNALLLAGSLLAMPVHAQEWPGTQPVTLIVPSSPGGAADMTARTIAKFLSDKAGVSTIVEDKPGAGGIIGTAAVKDAAADGHTFLISTNSTQSANQFLYKKLPYDPVKDFVNVGMIGKFGTVAVVAPDSRIDKLADLVALAKEKPDDTFYGYYSSSSHVPSELFKEYAGVNAQGASYKNITHILTDLRGGLIQFAFVDYLTARGQIANKALKPIAVTGAQRNPLWPDVPTTDSDYPGFIVEGWLGLSAPAGTPAPIVEKMNDYLAQAAQDKTTHDTLSSFGLQPESMDVQAFGQFVREDTQRWKKWIATAKIQPK